MYGRQSGKDLHSIQSGPPKTESNEIDLFPFSSFSSIWFQVNKEGGKGKASIALTHTHTRTHTSIASAYFSPPFFLSTLFGVFRFTRIFRSSQLLAKRFSLCLSPAFHFSVSLHFCKFRKRDKRTEPGQSIM